MSFHPRFLQASVATAALAFFVNSSDTAEIPRARDIGIPFDGVTGKHNAITDVPGVEVGHTTLIAGEGDLKIGKGPVRTGVTAILPTGKTFRPIFAAWHSLNGNGEMTGTTWISESGYLEEPILISNTHSVGAVSEAVIAWRAKAGYHAEGDGWSWASLPVVAETWDGRLNDIHGFHVKRHHVFAALDSAAGGPVAEGNVGGGTGMVCHRFKSGIGTASRRLSSGHTLGVLVQANYGSREDLRIAGVPVGREISDLQPVMHGLDPKVDGGSIIAIVATDAPFAPHQLKRIAKRVPLGIGRTGGFGSNSSGDIFLAFSTANATTKNKRGLIQFETMPNDEIDPFFRATVQATEEAIINALVAADTMTGINGNTVYALPLDRVRAILRRHNRLTEP
jgi:D-aminopeptidase